MPWPRGPAAVRQCLEAADRWARALGLTARRDVLSGTEDNPAGDLVASSDSRLNDLLRTSFFLRPTPEGKQLDLFLDSPVPSAANALLDALGASDPDQGRRARARLVALVPGHAHAAPAAALIEMLETPAPGDAVQGLEWTRRLEREWAPAASALFGARGAELLAPRWCAAGRAIESGRPDPRHPERHPSAAYLRGLDWPSVKRSVLATPACEAEPVLLARLAEAEWRLGHRHRAVSHWFTLCWRTPEAFRALIAGRDFPDPALRDAWHPRRGSGRSGVRHVPRVVSGLDAAPRVRACPRPSRSHRANGAVVRNAAERAIPSAPSGCSRLSSPSPATDAESMERRRELGSIHPGLLRRYLAKLESRPVVGRPSSP